MIKDKDLIKLIREIASDNDISSYQIGENTPVSNKTAYNILNDDTIKPRRKTLNIILDYLEETITGTKESLEIKEEFKTPQVAEPPATYQKGVPYYDVEFAAGFEDFTQSQQLQPTSFIKHPFFNGCDYVIRASGQSMAKIIKHGDAIGIVKIENWQEFLPFGEIYAIVTKDNYRMIKIITAGKTADYFTLISKPSDSKKEEFPPQQIKKTLILNLFKVQASSYLF